MKTIIALAAVALLAGCATQSSCVQPDPLEPKDHCWNKGVNCGEPLGNVNAK